MHPVPSFQTALEGLRSCTPDRIPHMLLSRDSYCRLACIPEESLPSKTVCVKAAQERLSELYGEAVKQMESYQDSRSSTSALSTFQAALNRRLSDLRAALGLCRTVSTAAVVNRIMSHLDGAAILEAVDTANQDLCLHYALPTAESYFSKISYDVYDPSEFEEGIGKLIAFFFIRHGYDLLPAVQALENDVNELLRGYQAAFQALAQAEIERSILSPVQSKLPLLQNVVEGGVFHE